MSSPVQPQVFAERAHEDAHGRETPRVPRSNLRQTVYHLWQPGEAQASARIHRAHQMPRERLHLHVPERHQARKTPEIPLRRARAPLRGARMRKDIQHHREPQSALQEPSPGRNNRRRADSNR
ncbi:hypothetical protein G195_007996 [Phytophthora kernoviae 00238/432]|uniref:Uncharacterized protein n=2 Tax=Phytophthora kernoviae TaxID=325452 RepID=A0A3F2RU39_9STRA|nr:hypothetical protein G195_007996 [Phytophthora kernoviae 00238/432]RLN63765.1 hypothetical protein BBP00_00003881 [Phytophthora kernoviae]